MIDANEEWRRVRITGTLQTESPLHVGDGDATPTHRAARDGSSEAVLINTVCRDGQGRPHIPASTLRGAMRARLANQAERERLFGSAEGDTGRMGKLRVYDALLDGVVTIEERSGIAIDPLFGVAESHKLFTDHFVPSGKRFALTIEADRVSEADVARTLALLDTFDGAIASGIGGGHIAKDGGRLKWDALRVQAIHGAAVKDWLSDSTSGAVLPWKDVVVTSSAAVSTPLPWSTGFEISFTSPWLVDDPALHREKSATEQHPPDLEFRRTPDRKALLPATSLKGWLRARARRIVMTVLVDRSVSPGRAARLSSDMIAEIFGSTRRGGWLVVTDAQSANPNPGHRQQFVAIDRFTGGAAKGDRKANTSSGGKLYDAHAAAPCDVTGQIGFRAAASDADWRLALLAMLFRDAGEGDFVVGWGKARGYGQGKFELTKQQDAWDWTSAAKLKPHLDALRAKLDTISEADHG